MTNDSRAARPEVPQLRLVCETQIYHHVFGNADREVGGVLVGKIARPGVMPLITGAIPAIAADEQRATLTFTQDTWEHVHRVLDRDFVDDQIVGWYHSHPSFGIFLSGHDLFIHRNFFGSPSQIALVVDPIAQEEGIFAWRKSTNDVDLYMKQPTPAGWYVRKNHDDQAFDCSPATEVKDGSGQTAEPLRTYPLVVLAVALITGFLTAFIVAYAFMRDSSDASVKPAPTSVTHPAPTTR